MLTLTVIFLLLCLFASLILNSAGFNRRCEGNENLKYFTAKDFDNLNALPVSFKSDKGQTLNGFYYTGARFSGNYKGLVVFSHGMGGGHLSYTTEINAIAQRGFAVLAYDNTGTCSSEGKSLRGFAQGVIDLKYAVEFAKQGKYADLPLLLAGHSWGAYSVCNAAAITDPSNIKGILAFSPFDSVNKLICDTAKLKTKLNLSFLNPFFNVVNRVKFGKTGLLKSTETIASNQIPTLVMHGGNDMSVNISNSPAGLKNRIEANKNARVIVYDNRMHNVYLSREAEQYLNDIFTKTAALAPNSREAYEIYESIDYSLITKEDMSVMETALGFLEDCAGNL